jgi:hypothetical protein
MSMQIKINGQTFRQPDNAKVATYNLTKSGRTASGKMTMDLVAKKKKLFLEYKAISGRDMDKILSLIDGAEMFFTVTYYDNGMPYEFCGYVGEIERTRFRSDYQGGWYWKDVSFNLIEQ